MFNLDPKCRTRYKISVNNLYLRIHRINYICQVSIVAHGLLLYRIRLFMELIYAFPLINGLRVMVFNATFNNITFH